MGAGLSQLLRASSSLHAAGATSSHVAAAAAAAEAAAAAAHTSTHATAAAAAITFTHAVRHASSSGGSSSSSSTSTATGSSGSSSSQTPIQWVFLGAPGVGKGTYASHAAKHFQVAHIATGDLIRAEIKAGSELGKKVGVAIGLGGEGCMV